MAFRHPHPLLYVALALGIATSILAPGLASIRELPPDATFLSGVGRFLIAAAIPAIIWLVVLTVPFFILDYLFRLRPGNRVTVSHGEYAGMTGTITDDLDPRPAAPIPVALDFDGTERVINLSHYDIAKHGIRSYLR